MGVGVIVGRSRVSGFRQLKHSQFSYVYLLYALFVRLVVVAYVVASLVTDVMVSGLSIGYLVVQFLTLRSVDNLTILHTCVTIMSTLTTPGQICSNVSVYDSAIQGR